MAEQQKTVYELKVPEGQHESIRLDAYITSFIENATRNKVQQAIKDGYVFVNKKVEKPSYKMQPGDEIYIELPKAPPPEAVPEAIRLDIVFEDDDIIIINKPAGMVVHPAFGNWSGTLVNGLLYHVDNLAENDDDDLRPGIVHRLDKDTSGLLVVAKNEAALANLSAQFAAKEVERTYWAVVWGTPPEEEGTIEGNIGRSPKDRKLMTVVSDTKGKRAVTHFKVLEYFDYLSLLELKLETGRTHQIRVHLAHKGFYVFGDLIYGGAAVRYGPNTGSRKVMFHRLLTGLNRQALHAKTLGFRHPKTNQTMQFDSDLPDDMQHVLDMLYRNCKSEY